MAGSLASLIQRKNLIGGEGWAVLFSPDGGSFLVLEGISCHHFGWPGDPNNDELVLVGTGSSNHCSYVALVEKAEDIVSQVGYLMYIKRYVKVQNPNGCAEGAVAQAAADVGFPIYQLIGRECQPIVVSEAHAAAEICNSNEDLRLLPFFKSLHEKRLKLSATLLLDLQRREFVTEKYSSVKEINFGSHGYQTGSSHVAVASRQHGDIGQRESRAQLFSATRMPVYPVTISGGTSAPAACLPADLFVDIPLTGDGLDALAEAETGGARLLLQRNLGPMAHGFGNLFTTVTTGAKWVYNKLRYCLAVITHGGQFSGLPLTTAHQEGLSERTKRLIDVMAQVYAACLAGCVVSYPVLKDAPVHISATIYGGLAFIAVISYIAMLSRSEARVRLTFRLVCSTAVGVLTVSFVSQLSGPTYVKVVSALAGAVLNIFMMLLPF